MNEIVIELTEVNPQEFYGDGNSTIEILREYFPKLKIVARGNKIKAYGEGEILEEFEKRIDMLVLHFAKFNRLDKPHIEGLNEFLSNACDVPEGAEFLK